MLTILLIILLNVACESSYLVAAGSDSDVDRLWYVSSEPGYLRVDASRSPVVPLATLPEHYRFGVRSRRTLPPEDRGLGSRRYLFVHQKFPAQWRHLSFELAESVDTGLFGWLRSTYTMSVQGVLALHALREFSERNGGWRPDVIVAHGAWGEVVMIRALWSDAPVVHYCEWYYRPHTADNDWPDEIEDAKDDAADKEKKKKSDGVVAMAIGRNGTSYGPAPEGNYLEREMWRHPELPRDRLGILHGLPQEKLRVMLRHSRVRLYWSYHSFSLGPSGSR
jgi:Glycosyl transferase family 4 group